MLRSSIGGNDFMYGAVYLPTGLLLAVGGWQLAVDG
jgi:hypothetical protein